MEERGRASAAVKGQCGQTVATKVRGNGRDGWGGSEQRLAAGFESEARRSAAMVAAEGAAFAVVVQRSRCGEACQRTGERPPRQWPRPAEMRHGWDYGYN
ncbi:ATP-dependent Clp protease proteolytic subunit [Sesbania bispinosa]|nr:ATP-dependent Clp protease proteolytic subunit [Sesbania bispinosa]